MDSAPQKSRRRRSIRNLRRSSANFILSGKSVLDDGDPLVDDAESTKNHLSTLVSDYGSAWLDEKDLQKARDVPAATGWSDEKDYDAVDTEIEGLSADRRNDPQNEEFPATKQCNELSSEIFPAGLITSTSGEVIVEASTNVHHITTHDRQSCDSFEKSRYGSDSLETMETKLCHQLDENIALSSADNTGNNSEGLGVLDLSNIESSPKEDQRRNVRFRNPSLTVNRDTPIESLSTSDTSSEHLNQGFVSQQQSSPLEKLSSDHASSIKGDSNILSVFSPSDMTRPHSNNGLHVYSTDSGHSLASDKTDKSPFDEHNMALCVSSSSASAQSDISDTGMYSVSASSSDTGKEHITLKFTRLSEIWTPRSAVPVKSKSDTSASTGKVKMPGKTDRPSVSHRNMPRFVGGSQSHRDSTVHPTTSKISTIVTSSSTPLLVSGKKKYRPNPAKAKPKTVDLHTPCLANSESQNQSLPSSSVQNSSSVTGANMSNIIQQLSQKLKTLQASMGLAGSEESNNAETPCPIVRSRSRESNNHKKLSQIHQPSDQQEDRITSNDGIDKVNDMPSEYDIRPLCDSMLELSVSKSKVNSGDSESGMATLPNRNEMSEGMDGDVSLLQEHVIVTSNVMPSRYDAEKDAIVLQPNIQHEGKENQLEPMKTCRQKKRLRLSLKKETTEMPEVTDTRDVGQKPEMTDTKDVEPKIPEIVEESASVPALGLEQSKSENKQPPVDVTEGMKSDEYSANSNADAPTDCGEVNLYIMTAMECRKETDASKDGATHSKDKSKQIVQEVRLQKKIQQKGKGHQHFGTVSFVSGKSKADEAGKLKCESKPTGHVKKSSVSKGGEKSVRKLGNEQIVNTVDDGTSGVSKVKGKKSVTKSSDKGLETSKAASELDHSKKKKIHMEKKVKNVDKCGQNATNNAKQEDVPKHSTEVEEMENIPEFDHAKKEKIHKEKRVKNVDKCGQNATNNAKQEDVSKHCEGEEMENIPEAHDSVRLSLSQQDTNTAEKKNGKQATEKPSKAKSQRRSSRFFSPPDEFRSNDHIEQQSEHKGNELVEKQSNTKSQRRSSRFFSPPEEFRSKDHTEQQSECNGNESVEKQLSTKSQRRSSRFFSPPEEFKSDDQTKHQSDHQSLQSSEPGISSLPEPTHNNKESSTDLNTCETVCEETENKENISDTLGKQTSHLNVEDYRAILMEDIQKFGNTKDGEILEEVIDDFVSLCVNEDNRLENSINVKDGNESRKKRQRRRSSNIYKASADNDNHREAENRDPAFAGDANAYCANEFFRSEASVTPEYQNHSETFLRLDQCLESDFIGSAEFSSACVAGLAKEDAPYEMIVNDEKYSENCSDKDLDALEVNDGQREDIDILSHDADCDLHEENLDVPHNISIRARRNRKSWDLSQLTDITETRRSTRRSSKGSKDDKQVVESSKLHQPGECSSQQEQEPALSNEDSGSPQAISPTLENLYRNKNYVLPKPKSWETIKENPSATQPIFTKQKFKRFLVFGEHHASYAKLQRRHKKALDVHNRNLNRVGLHVPVSDEDFEQKMLDVQLFLEGSPNN